METVDCRPSDAQVEVEIEARKLALVGAVGAPRLDPDRLVEVLEALDRDLGIQLDVHAVERPLEGAVEQLLDVLLVTSAARRRAERRGR